MMWKDKPQVAVFFGGEDGMNDLSEETGYWACQYIPRTSYRIRPVRVLNDGRWQVPLGSLPKQGKIDGMMHHLFEAVPAVTGKEGLSRLLRHPVSSIMTLVRGKGGDDGSMHGLAKTLGVPVVGCSQEACQQTSDKYATGQRLHQMAKFPITRRYRAADEAEKAAAEVRDNFVPPLFIKPLNSEGSAGVEEIDNPDELLAALKRALAKGDVLVQERVPGTEVNVTLWGEDPGQPRLLPPTVVFNKGASFYDHYAKRRSGRVALATGGEVGTAVQKDVEEIARGVFAELNCEGLVSMDFMVDGHQVTLLEANTIPTLTRLTPLREQLIAAHIHPTSLFDRMIRRSLR